ncbi:helix-turn-helix domain-containing protein [Myroides sp. WP-1]|uniref:helix-turn-helix domain-containing protein n=1 Tax=Myroides sp. WP-1 TaxID=2759944 RepID=UPI0015F78ACF|nr:helix-turn-helix domain-containing protein [Myroides sp. WP-1]MBB1138861.1 helix-turn-helix domain-containing protein [Myroides sp. WP-1]
MKNKVLQENQNTSSSIDVLTKLKVQLGVKSSKKLAQIFDLKPNTISSWKKRNTLCYAKIIEVCKQHQIDLNELFYSNYPNKAIEKYYANVPIIYIDDYLEYYLSIKTKQQKLKQIYLPKSVNFDIIIQLYTSIDSNDHPQLIYAFCQKITLSSVEEQQHYVFFVQNKGFQYYKIVEVNKEYTHFKVMKGTDCIELKMEEIIEVFQWQESLSC